MGLLPTRRKGILSKGFMQGVGGKMKNEEWKMKNVE
jgi:hypothetical protein